jgi:hypothetical protein
MENSEICKEKHKAIENELGRQNLWLCDHEKKIDRLDRSDAVNTTALENLCSQIGSQTKAIWGLVSGIFFVLLGFLVWYIQNIKK